MNDTFLFSLGRGRAEDILITTTGSGKAEHKDNKIKEPLMNQAITFINQMAEQTFQEKIEAEQQNARREREKKQQEEERKAQMAQNKPVGEFSLGDGIVGMLTHMCSHKPLKKIKVIICNYFTCGLMPALVICMQRKQDGHT